MVEILDYDLRRIVYVNAIISKVDELYYLLTNNYIVFDKSS